MAIELNTKLAHDLQALAFQAGIAVTEGIATSGFGGAPTERYTLMTAADSAKRDAAVEKASDVAGPRATLELSKGFEIGAADFASPVHTYLLEAAQRLRNPRPDVTVTLGGLPVSFGQFSWPFHRSTSGADTYIVHGEARLEDGKTTADQQLRAKIAGSMTVTFAEIVPAPEQPFAESFIYNAVRKTMDQGQLELTKSGNRQVVMVTTRFYSAKQGRFIFNETNAQQLQDFLAAKVYWCSGVLGGEAPVWIADPRDAQYLNTTTEDLKKAAEALAREGVIQLQPELTFASATEALLSHRDLYESRMAEAVQFTKPSFNEEMRSGKANM